MYVHLSSFACSEISLDTNSMPTACKVTRVAKGTHTVHISAHAKFIAIATCANSVDSMAASASVDLLC